MGNSGNFQWPGVLARTVQIRASPSPRFSHCSGLSQQATVWGNAMEIGDRLVCGLGRSKDARAGDAVQAPDKQGKRGQEPRLAPRLLHATATASCRRGRDSHVTLPCLVCDMPAAAVHTAEVGGRHVLMMGPTRTLLRHPDARGDAAFRRGRAAVTRGREDGSLHQFVVRWKCGKGLRNGAASAMSSCVYSNRRAWWHTAGSHVPWGRRLGCCG
jgi:hypothetical protein